MTGCTKHGLLVCPFCPLPGEAALAKAPTCRVCGHEAHGTLGDRCTKAANGYADGRFHCGCNGVTR